MADSPTVSPDSPSPAMSEPAAAREFRTLDSRGLDHRLPPMRLWHKAKKIGIWDPQAIDFSQDRAHWQRLSPLEQRVILHQTSLFQAGEESVTLDLLPLIQAIAGEGRLEEEMFLTSFLWEEAKHVEAFDRFLTEVVVDRTDLAAFQGPCYEQIFHHELPTALGALRDDPSPSAQAAASVTYNMIVEGVLAETGYHAYAKMLQENGILPGMQTVVGHLKSDEARHLAYGVFLLSRLVAEHGDDLWQVVEARMQELLPLALGVVQELFAEYPDPPFGLDVDEFVLFASMQFQRRFQRIEKARSQTLDEIYRLDDEQREVAA
ncbi:MAG: R2-like ligand-binding oxidase [Acidobacteriota bacterium]